MVIFLSGHRHDKNLVWEPSDYGGLAVMYFTQDQIWAPSLTAFPVTSLWNLPLQNIVQSNGDVTFNVYGTFENRCSLRMTYFPFDHQECAIMFASEGASTIDIDLIPWVGKLYDTFIENGQWEVLDVRTDKSNAYAGSNLSIPAIILVLELQRRPAYYVINIILPVIFVSLLGQFSFLVPVESGERLSYALSVQVSLTVYFTSIESIIPRSSIFIPLLTRYLASLFTLNVLCIVASLIIFRIRNSKVVLERDGLKVMYVFGVPFRIQPKSDTMCRKWQGKRQGKIGVISDDTKDSAGFKSSEDKTEENTSTRPTLNDPLENMSVKNRDDVDKGTRKNSRDQDYGQGLHNYNAGLGQAKISGTTEVEAEDESDVDPDVKRITDRVNLWSFVFFFLCFIIVTVYTFAVLNIQED